MRKDNKKRGSVMLIAVFVIALLSSLVIGMLQMNTEEIQLMQNYVYASQAMAVAEAGLNDALSEIRTDDEWNSGFTNKSFGSHSYTVKVSGGLPNLTIESTGRSSQGFITRIEADITVGSASPYIVQINRLRINEDDEDDD